MRTMGSASSVLVYCKVHCSVTITIVYCKLAALQVGDTGYTSVPCGLFMHSSSAFILNFEVLQSCVVPSISFVS